MFSKGQMSSPFELLVAMIIMSFVVIIGTQMLMAANENTCMASIDKELGEFKQKLEDTAQRRGQNKFDFRPEDCFNANKTNIQIAKYADSGKCSVVCGKPIDECWALIFNSQELANGFRKKCLNLPSLTTFKDSAQDCPTDEPQLDGYTAINPTKGINTNNPASGVGFTTTQLKPGTYIIRNIAGAGSTYPEICMYRKA